MKSFIIKAKLAVRARPAANGTHSSPQVPRSPTPLVRDSLR